MKYPKLDVLAIAAHPDDIELSCGGTLAKLSKQGRKVGVVDLTQGEMGTRGTPELRLQEADEAAQILGLTVRENLKFYDGKFTTGHINKIRLIRVIRKYRPEILLIPHWLERHPDHERTHRLARDAWFYSGLIKIVTEEDDGTVLEAFRPKLCYHYMQKYEFEPTFVVDISDVYDIRMEAIRAYKSQFHNPESRDPETILSKPDFMQFMETRARYYGNRIGVQYGEPFSAIATIGVRDMFDLVF
jgi:N-acetylglucosamine malate deacetylase 1